ncbi:MAG: radical SAM family heme chaperone HemW, partial [Terriglobales bacterium]
RGTEGETRWGNPDTLETYLAPLRAGSLPRTAVERVSPQAQLEEALFLGLRRNVGVNLKSLAAEFGPEPVEHVETTLRALREDGLLWTTGEQVHLTARGRLLSNEVFASLIG